MPPGDDRSNRRLSWLALVSGAYDIALGLTMLFGRGLLVSWFGVAEPIPPIHADLNALFLVAIGLGYALPWRDPRTWRAYLWIMGPFLKGVGALAFVADHFLRHSPDAYLLFTATDGTLALVTLVLLLDGRARANGRARL